jgi:hypothetical protein
MPAYVNVEWINNTHGQCNGQYYPKKFKLATQQEIEPVKPKYTFEELKAMFPVGTRFIANLREDNEGEVVVKEPLRLGDAALNSDTPNAYIRTNKSMCWILYDGELATIIDKPNSLKQQVEEYPLTPNELYWGGCDRIVYSKVAVKHTESIIQEPELLDIPIKKKKKRRNPKITIN